MTTDTTTETTTGVTVPVAEVLAAATALAKAGRWDTADALLGSARAADADHEGRAAIAVAAADAALDRDLFTGSHRAAAALATAEPLVAATGDPATRWDLAALQLYSGYIAELLGDSERLPEFGPEGRDPAKLADLLAWADRLTVDAPDAQRRGWASFYGGLVADNLMGDRAGGGSRYRSALHLGEQAGDGLLASYALRHLGGHDDEDGNLAAAREKWEKATDLRAADGHVTGVLAQQIWLAVIAARSGDPTDRAGARAVAAEVRRWATALGLSWLVKQADDLLAADPGSAARSGSAPADA